MAIVNFHVTKYGRNRGSAAGTVASSDIRLSGQDTIVTAENLEDATGDIECAVGEVLTIHTDAALRIVAGGGTATATTGMYIPASQATDIEIHAGGTVSAIEAG